MRALLAALVLAWLFQRNPLIANPSLPLLGWLLLLHAFVPPRPCGSLAARVHGAADPNWRLPRHLHLAAWVMLALCYQPVRVGGLTPASRNLFCKAGAS
ncbi:MAG: hypothetical protein IT472_11770 [Thermomonas sp.]|uniref:hypothetical protein n=1 Tax=Thermomonas sp. TaxID=1971895 RepID=UPI0026067591|nr:hypothetical protein [Thermomonas sp.]MCC7097841.1 hypothetical protein [Thermomonas sp.]